MRTTIAACALLFAASCGRPATDASQGGPSSPEADVPAVAPAESRARAGSSPAADDVPPPVAGLAILVRNGSDDSPIGGVTVRVRADEDGEVVTATTDARGLAHFAQPAATGLIFVLAGGDGWTRTGRAFRDRPDRDLPLELSVKPAGTVRGRVTWTGGAPAADALVQLELPSGRGGPETRSDGEGWYSLDVPVGAFGVVRTASSSARAMAREPVHIRERGQVVHRDIVMTRETSIQVRVLLPGGRLCESADVTVTDVPETERPQGRPGARLLGDGYLWRGAPGRKRVTVETDAGWAEPIEVVVAEGESLVRDVFLQPLHELVVRVEEAASHARVYVGAISRSDPDAAGRKRVLRDTRDLWADGSYRIGGLAPGHYDVWVRTFDAPDFVIRGVPVPGDPVVARANASWPRVRAALVGPDGVPVRVAISFRPWPTEAPWRWSRWGHVPASDDGVLEFDCQPEAKEVEFSAQGWRTVSVSVTPRPGELVDLGRITLRRDD